MSRVLQLNFYKDFSKKRCINSGGQNTYHEILSCLASMIYRGYYKVVRRYQFYFRVAKQYLTNERSEWVNYCFYHEKIEFKSSSRRVMFFLLYRQKDIDKIIEGNYQNYVIDKLTCEIMENKPLGSRMQFLWILRVVYFPVKHSRLYSKSMYKLRLALLLTL